MALIPSALLMRVQDPVASKPPDQEPSHTSHPTTSEPPEPPDINNTEPRRLEAFENNKNHNGAAVARAGRTVERCEDVPRHRSAS